MSTFYPPFSDPTAQDIADNLMLIAELSGAESGVDYERIRANVEKGLGPVLYPVGYKFKVPHTVYGEIKFVVMGHDQIAAANGKPHTMTLLSEKLLANIQFDATEAFYYCETALPAGTYHFTMNNQAWYTADNNKTFQFTLASDVPAKSQLVWSMTYNQTIVGKTVNVFSGPTSTTVAQSATISEGSEGTDLGSMGSGNLNHTHRAIFGSNNYKESAMRQFLNSNLPAGQFWLPQTKFDRPPSWLTTLAGFETGFTDDFLSIVAPAIVKCSTNNTYESPDSTTPKNSKYTLNEKFFLPSRYEVYASSDVADDSVQMTYYVGTQNYDKIKLQASGAPYYWWLRTPRSGYACGVRCVNPDGSLSFYDALHSNGCVPACIIA